jgi:hypothetical protein
MSFNDKEIHRNVKIEADKWLEIIDFTGKAELPKIKKELKKIRYKGKQPHVEVTDDIAEVPSLIRKGAKALYGAAAEEELSKVFPENTIWDYYFMAFYDVAFKQVPEKNFEFMQHSLFDACRYGLGFLVNLGPLLVGLSRPEAHRERIDGVLRIHKEDGPAITWGKTKQYWWKGIKVPREWIEEKEVLNKQTFTRIQNQEQKRAFCEILGWEKVTDLIGCKKIQSDDWGDLVEAQLDDDEGHLARFADVRCPSTGRRYLIRTSPLVKTCKEALATSARIEPDEYLFEAES